MDGWMDGWMDGCMDGWMDGSMDGCVAWSSRCCIIISRARVRSSTRTLSQGCALNSFIHITITCLDSLNQSIDILLLLLLWSAEQIVFVLLVLQS